MGLALPYRMALSLWPALLCSLRHKGVFWCCRNCLLLLRDMALRVLLSGLLVTSVASQVVTLTSEELLTLTTTGVTTSKSVGPGPPTSYPSTHETELNSLTTQTARLLNGMAIIHTVTTSWNTTTVDYIPSTPTVTQDVTAPFTSVYETKRNVTILSTSVPLSAPSSAPPPTAVVTTDTLTTTRLRESLDVSTVLPPPPTPTDVGGVLTITSTAVASRSASPSS
jgi:hypothetical protein